MALATQCPHCHTTFRVASDQLKLRGGIVRCGTCQRIFDGSAHLIDLDALAAGKTASEPAPAVEATPDLPEPAPDSQSVSAPVYTLDLDTTLDPFGILPKSAPAPADEVETAHEQPQDPAPPHGDVLAHAVDTAADTTADAPAAAPAPQRLEPRLEAAAYASPGRIEPSFELPVDEELVAQALPGDEPEAAPGPGSTPPDAPHDTPAPSTDIPSAALPLRASAGDDMAPPASAATPASKSARAKAAEARARRSRLTPTKIEAPKLRVPETDEPEFVKRSRKQEQSGRTLRIFMGAGAALLLLLLAAQLMLNFRNVLAARYPDARPALGAVCTLLGCRVELPTQIENLAIETGELATLGPNTYSLNTLLRNQGSLVQAWPSIELELTDANDKPVLRRVFSPAEYLPQGVSAPAGFGARSEQAVRLHFALTDLKPSGYHIAVFYP
jgi:predicted Zn finger-like uncharacterized protein